MFQSIGLNVLLLVQCKQCKVLCVDYVLCGSAEGCSPFSRPRVSPKINKTPASAVVRDCSHDELGTGGGSEMQLCTMTWTLVLLLVAAPLSAPLSAPGPAPAPGLTFPCRGQDGAASLLPATAR